MPLITKYWAGHHLSTSESCAWNHLFKIGTQTHVAGTLLCLFTQSYLTGSLAWPKPMVPGFRLMKLRLLMSHCKKNSVRDTAMDKRWICWDFKRSTLQECGPSQSGEQRPWNVVWFSQAGLLHRLRSGRIIPTIGESPTPQSFDSVLELSRHLWVSFSLQIKDQGLVEFDLSSWTHLILIGLRYVLGLCHSFKVHSLGYDPFPVSCSFPGLSGPTMLLLQSSGRTTRK